MSALGAIAWGVAVRPLLRARDLVVAGAVRKSYAALWQLERNLPPHQPSARAIDAAEAAGHEASSLTWGETPFATARAALVSAGVAESSTVVDVGAGRGMVLLAARSLGANARGIEIDERRARPAIAILKDAGAELVCGDALAPEHASILDRLLDGATHVWLSWTCLPPEVRARLSERLASLPGGTRAIAFTWDLPAPFRVEKRVRLACSWGFADVAIAQNASPPAPP